jgi:hypothetical protein
MNVKAKGLSLFPLNTLNLFTPMPPHLALETDGPIQPPIKRLAEGLAGLRKAFCRAG